MTNGHLRCLSRLLALRAKSPLFLLFPSTYTPLRYIAEPYSYPETARPATDSYRRPYLADNNTLNNALASYIDAWADMFDSVISNGILLMFDSVISNGILLMLDRAVTSVRGGGGGGEGGGGGGGEGGGEGGGGSRVSVEHTEPHNGPGMEAAPPRSQVPSELPDVCSWQAEI